MTEADKSTDSMVKPALWSIAITFAVFYFLSIMLYETSDTTRADFVIDGDTFVTGEDKHIRIADVDCAESHTPEGEEATQYLTNTIEGQHVQIQKIGTGKYGRTIAQVYIDGRNVGQLLIGRPECRRWE